jgi:hypothetical protein
MARPTSGAGAGAFGVVAAAVVDTLAGVGAAAATVAVTGGAGAALCAASDGTLVGDTVTTMVSGSALHADRSTTAPMTHQEPMRPTLPCTDLS